MEHLSAALLPFCAALAALPSGALAKAAKGAKKAITEFVLEGSRWQVLFSEEQGKNFFHNTKTGQSQWVDPRKVATAGSETLTTFLIFMLPFALMLVAGGAYLLYIRVAHPDVLQPPKKAKGKYVHSLAKAAKEKKKATVASPSAGAVPVAPSSPTQEKKDN